MKTNKLVYNSPVKAYQKRRLGSQQQHELAAGYPWLYRTMELVGRAITTHRMFGASNPVDNTPKLNRASIKLLRNAAMTLLRRPRNIRQSRNADRTPRLAARTPSSLACSTVQQNTRVGYPLSTCNRTVSTMR